MSSKIAIVLGFVVAVAAIIFFTARHKGGGSTGGATGPGTGTGTGERPRAGSPVEIEMLYSTEKKDWIEEAAADFQKQNPDIKLTLVGKGSLDAAQLILDGKEKPVIWSPADSMVLKLFADDWETKNRVALLAPGGDDAPQPLVLTPLVFVAWEDRGQLLEKASGGHITWASLRKAVISNQGWPAVGGPATWGFVKLGHTDPTRSNSGLQALLLMSYEFYSKNRGLEVGDLLKADYQAWVKGIEGGVSRFEPSTGTFMTDMVRFGPSKYDIAVVYENLAISQLENAQGRWGNLRVYYPSVTLWSDHPVAVLQGDWVTAPQRAAAARWIAFLKSRPVQERALRFGFRPADTSVPVKSADQANPWTRLAQYGIQVDVPPAAEVPEGPVVRNLITMWTRVVGPR